MTQALDPAAAVKWRVRRIPATVQSELRRLIWTVAVADCVVIGSSLAVAWRLRRQLGLWDRSLVPQRVSLAVGVSIFLLWALLLALKGAYSQRLFGGGLEEFKAVAIASVLAAGLITTTCYLLKFDLSRGFVVLAFAFGLLLLLVERYGMRKVVYALRRKGRLRHRVVAIGGPGAVDEVIDVFNREAYLGYEVVGACVPKHMSVDGAEMRVPILGSADEAKAACEVVGADTVLVTGGTFSTSADLRRVGWQLERSNIDLVVVPSIAEVAGPRIHLRPVGGLPLMHVEPPQADAAGRLGKRSFDIIGASLLLLLFAPTMIVIAGLIKLNDGGPVLFRQRRVGRGGQPFECLKFRSMCVDAEARLVELRNLNESDGVLFKMRRDPRTTGIGRFLRRFSIDELPQLLNVVAGSMSLVGPRPPLPTEVAGYASDVRRRLLVRPGMTGLWQVSGRSQLSWRESVRLDLYYVDNWSMLSDLGILAKTLRAVIASEGAY